MLRLVAVLSITSLWFCISATPDVATTKFKDAHEDGDPIEVASSEQVIVKTADRVLVLRFTEPTYKQSGEYLTETCSIRWLLISQDEVTCGDQNSSIKYYVKNLPGGNDRDLTRVEGSQEIKLDAFALEWSYGTDNSIWLNFRGTYKYATVKSVPDK